jgi:hypothetical protein
MVSCASSPSSWKYITACGSTGASWPTATARSASPWRTACIASTIASIPLMLWLVMQALGPFKP